MNRHQYSLLQNLMFPKIVGFFNQIPGDKASDLCVKVVEISVGGIVLHPVYSRLSCKSKRRRICHVIITKEKFSNMTEMVAISLFSLELNISLVSHRLLKSFTYHCEVLEMVNNPSLLLYLNRFFKNIFWDLDMLKWSACSSNKDFYLSKTKNNKSVRNGLNGV